MPPQIAQPGRPDLLAAVLVTAVLAQPVPLAGQQLPLQRDYPGTGPFECPAPAALVEPTPDQRRRAGQLTSDATQALILGDLEGARTLLSEAAGTDGTSPELAYRHARVLEDLRLVDAAILEYCRALSLGTAAAGIDDARTRLDALYDVVRERISDRALAAFVQGLHQADDSLYAEAAQSFGVAIEENPEWPAAMYNRAIVLDQMGLLQESLADYRRYLELTPSEVDPDVVSVSERIGTLEGVVALPTPSPNRALALGVVFPGLGQYYSGRSKGGTLVLSASAAVVLTGLMVKDVTVRCLTAVPPGEDCPSGQIVDESTARPFLVPALAAAALGMIGGAVEAFVKAKRQREAQAEAVEAITARGIRIAGPSITMVGSRADLNFLRLRFR